MTNNEMTAAMFEEIKEKMASMDEKLDDVNYGLEQAKGEIITCVEKQQSSSIKIENTVNYLIKLINASVDTLSCDIGKAISKLNNQANTNNALITEVRQVQKKRRKLMVKFIGFLALAVVSILFNIYLLNDNQRLKDRELQLNYLKVTNSVNKNVVNRLDTIFNLYRDKEAINKIKKVVRDHND